MKKIFFLLVVVTAGIIYTTHVFAQTEPRLNVTVSPTAIDLSLLPESTVDQKFRIRNNSNQDVTLGISVDTLANSENGQVLPVSTKTQDPSVKYIQFEHNKFTAKSREWTDVPFKIEIPKNASFSYYYAVRIGQIDSSIKSKNGQSKVLGEVIVPILVKVKRDGAIASAQLLSFQPKSFINQYLPVDFDVTVKNTGNIHLRPKGNIFIRTGGEKDLSVLEVNQASGAILPGGKRTFTTSWMDGFIVRTPVMEDGAVKLGMDNKPETQLTINWDKFTSFRIGKYNATAVLVYDDGKRDVTMEANTSFWVIPYIPIIVMVVSLIILVVVIRFVLKWYVASQVKKYQSR